MTVQKSGPVLLDARALKPACVESAQDNWTALYFVRQSSDGLPDALLLNQRVAPEFRTTNQGVASSNLAGRAKINYLKPVFTGFIFFCKTLQDFLRHAR